MWDSCLVADGCVRPNDGCLSDNGGCLSFDGCFGFDGCTMGCLASPLRMIVLVGLLLYGEWPMPAPAEVNSSQKITTDQ